MPDEPAAAEAAAAGRASRTFERVDPMVPTAVGHIQLVLADGRTSDNAGNVLTGTPGDDISATGAAYVIDQNGAIMSKKRTDDARPFLSAAGQQKVLEILDELRTNLGPVLLP
jgi:hypothetical protein